MQEEIATETDTQATEARRPRPPNAGAASTDEAGSSTKDAILEALKNVIDPELGLNIVDLGLVYDVQLDAQGDVDIQYSLTTMGCPIGPMIEDQMRGFLRGVPGVGRGPSRVRDPAAVDPRDDVGRGQGVARHLLIRAAARGSP